MSSRKLRATRLAAVEATIRYPRDYERWNPGLRGAWRKGWLAATSGVSRDACPYEDKRKPSGKLSWSRGFINAWRDGWDDYQRCDKT